MIFKQSKVMKLPVTEIIPNPSQPRTRFDPEGLRELCDSVRELGVIQPLTVRRTGKSWELVAGERRLRAAQMAGFTYVPCIEMALNERSSAVVALTENLQRRDLDCFEEAEGIRKLIEIYGLNQDEAAKRLGKSQSAVANKLRLLKLEKPLTEFIRANGLTERHARALLKTEDYDIRARTLARAVEDNLNVAQTERLLDTLISERSGGKTGRKVYIIKDIRVFLNAVKHACDVMRSGGINAAYEREERESEIVVTVRIPVGR